MQNRLPEIYKEVHGEDEKYKPFTIWDIAIDPLNPAADARVSVVLMKFLRARFELAYIAPLPETNQVYRLFRQLDVDATQEMLTQTLQWRKEVDVGEIMKHHSRRALGARTFGHDKAGRPVM